MLDSACRRRSDIVLVIGTGIALSSSLAFGSAQRSVAVSDSIEMTHIVEPYVQYGRYRADDFKFSPDGEFVAVVTRNGNLKTGLNDYTILLYGTREIRRFINGPDDASMPQARVLGRFSAAIKDVLGSESVRALRWMSDSRTLVFLGTRGEEPTQIYRLRIDTGAIERLTDHPVSISKFDIDPATGALVYATQVPAYHRGRGQPSFVVDNMYLLDVMDEQQEQYVWHYQFFAVQAGRPDAARAVGQLHVGIEFPETNFAIAPGGRWMVTASGMKQTRAEWRDLYHPLKAYWFTNMIQEKFDPWIMSHAFDQFSQFVLIDLKSGAQRVLLDAPAGNPGGLGGGTLTVSWLPNGRSVILGNTYLPVDTIGDAKERERRRQSPAVVEYDVETGRVTRIADLTIRPGEAAADEPLMGMTVHSDGSVTIMRGRQGSLKVSRYVKSRGRWIAAAGQAEQAREIELSVRQALTERPEIFAKDVATGRERRITDLNPQFRELKFGRTEVLTWQDRKGRVWRGAIVYPVDFKPGERYPLVIQTHGFYSDEYLLDGPYFASVYAAQAFAGKGMFAVQAPNPPTLGQAAQLEDTRLIVEGLIDSLDGRGWVDRHRVGIIGFSASGVAVEHIITFSDYDFAAATIADTYGISMAAYIDKYGFKSPGMYYIENMLGGAAPFGDQLDEWIKRSPTMNLARIRTAIRWEQFGTYFPPWWDSYAILRRFHRPAEFIVFPKGSHNLKMPLERYASQQGNVDWFAFWLKGEEDPDPAKAQQYERWRILKKQWEAVRKWH